MSTATASTTAATTPPELQTQLMLRASQLRPVALITQPMTFTSPATVHASWGELLAASASQADAVSAARRLSSIHTIWDITGNHQLGKRTTGIFRIEGGSEAGRSAVAQLSVDVGSNTPFTDFQRRSRPSGVITPITGTEMRSRFESQRLSIDSAPVEIDVLDRDAQDGLRSVTARLTALVDEQGVIRAV